MTALAILPGRARGPVLASPEGLSFWGGVDPATGRVIDAHHPLHGQSLAGCILALAKGLSTHAGHLTSRPVAEAFGRDWLEIDDVVA